MSEPIADLRIGALDYELEREALKSPVLGRHNYALAKIQLDDKLKGWPALAILFHELVHGWLQQAGDLGLKDKEIEAVCDTIAHGLTGLIRDNPHLPEVIKAVLNK